MEDVTTMRQSISKWWAHWGMLASGVWMVKRSEAAREGRDGSEGEQRGGDGYEGEQGGN